MLPIRRNAAASLGKTGRRPVNLLVLQGPNLDIPAIRESAASAHAALATAVDRAGG